MFAALGRLTSRRPWFVIAAWVVLAIAVVSLAPALETTQEESEFLPDHYESVQAYEIQEEKFPGASSPAALIVFEREDGAALTDDDQSTVNQIAEDLGPELGSDTFVQQVVTVSPDGQPNVSEDGRVQIGIVGLAEGSTGFDTQAFDDAKAMRDDISDLTEGTDLKVTTTGSVPQGLDSQESSEQALAIVGIATVVLIVVLLAVIFRSVIICLMPILVVTLVSMVATGLIGWANEAFDLKADSSIQTILVVVLYGIGTDYILFFLFRYRERLRQGEDTRSSVVHALERAGEAIASAGGAVIVAFLALLLSSLGIFKAIGPALAIAVAVTLLAALTLVPAVVTVLGRALFWPSKKWRVEPEAARFGRIGRSLGRRPGTFAGVSGLLLAVLAVFAFGFNPSFDFNSSLPEDVESTEALHTFQDHFAAGASEPVPVIVRAEEGTLDEGEMQAFGQALSEADGVAQVYPATLSEDGTAAQVSVVLDSDPVSDQALQDVKGPIRDAAHAAAPDGAEAFVGGTPGIFADLQSAMVRDYKVVFPVAALVIMLILALLLRSLVAPLYLMAAVGLSFAATLGATVIVFQGIGGENGLIFMLPIYIYLFVTALGTDYNILMIARLREEAREGKEPRPAAAEALKHAGPTIAAAGVILAGTFASLMLSGNSLMMSMGFALSFGIFIAAFVMAMFFTPALTALIGHAAWWPGHEDQKGPKELSEMPEEPVHTP
ncbi:MMPL family transporter [Nocardioides sp. YIM 152315]|uniref:MMPL family transporter n=1 Tax=Nocardioides sp. YIM 152315 TaxID=3031760 RepID=UPI0023DA65F5|nr:MMPL family transporter [Nocardioides sp. YIM 152315]MDF1604009.1 MMPL family transporter [Nocardioides sp. YIM 152315]